MNYCKSFLLCSLKNVFKFFLLLMDPKYLKIIDFRSLNIASPTSYLENVTSNNIFKFQMKQNLHFEVICISSELICLGFILFPSIDHIGSFHLEIHTLFSLRNVYQ